MKRFFTIMITFQVVFNPTAEVFASSNIHDQVEIMRRIIHGSQEGYIETLITQAGQRSITIHDGAHTFSYSDYGSKKDIVTSAQEALSNVHNPSLSLYNKAMHDCFATDNNILSVNQELKTRDIIAGFRSGIITSSPAPRNQLSSANCSRHGYLITIIVAKKEAPLLSRLLKRLKQLI